MHFWDASNCLLEHDVMLKFLQVVADTDCVIRALVVRWLGGTHDNSVDQ